jgi:hypothetical protein
MTRHTSLLLPITLAVMATVGCSADLGSRTCAAGREVACTCGGGAAGHQICRADGSGFGPCTGCDDDDGAAPRDGGHDAASDAFVEMPIDASSSDVDAAVTPPDAWAAPDTGPPPPRCAWVWLDRGGPAFQPHACRAGAGVVDGMLVDPLAFFTELVAGRDADTWESVMNDIEGELWSCGVGQQRGSGGDVRGRLFLPTAACPDSSPPLDDMDAMRLGVRQQPECWEHPADVVECR